MDNHVYGFKFEWEIRPLTLTALRLTKTFSKVIYDPTSDKYRQCTWKRAYKRVNEIRSPFWFKK